MYDEGFRKDNQHSERKFTKTLNILRRYNFVYRFKESACDINQNICGQRPLKPLFLNVVAAKSVLIMDIVLTWVRS